MTPRGSPTQGGQEPTYGGFAGESLCDELSSLPVGVPQATFPDHRILKKMLDDIGVGTFNEVPTRWEDGGASGPVIHFQKVLLFI